jgi:hypothetical protein
MVTQEETSLQSFEELDGMKFIGIADCHGIESFLPYEEHKKDLFYLKLRAMSNRQRHAVAYLVVLQPKHAGQILGRLRKGEHAHALNILKRATKVFFPDNYGKSWELIPNSDLDPWRGE